jgi:hypothetical protein
MSSTITGDFHEIDLTSGWETPPGYPPGVEAKILADSLDRNAKTGHLTMLMRYQPGAKDDRMLEHDLVEEVLFLEGEMEWVREDGSLVQKMRPYSYVCRPAGVPHGPFRSEKGCLILAMFYYPGK